MTAFSLAVWTNANSQVVLDSLYGNNSGSEFGYSVDLAQKGDWVVIGVPESNNIGDLVNTLNRRGAVYVYDRGADGYELKGQILGGNDANDYFGSSVAISNQGDVVVGSKFDSDTHSAGGSVRVYNYNEGTSIWDETIHIPSGQANEQFGWDVDITRDGTFFVASAVTHSYEGGPNSAGKVRVYKKDNDTWLACNAISYPGTDGSVEFGYAVAVQKASLNGQETVLVAVSAPKDNPNDLESSGQVWVYKTNADCSTPWTRVDEAISGDSEGDLFGHSVSLNTGTDRVYLAVGAIHEENPDNAQDAGSVRVYELTNDVWTQKGSTLYGEQTQQYFGHSLQIMTDRIAIGSSQFDIGNGYINQGKVDVYQFYDDWKQAIEKLQDARANSYLGSSLAFDGTMLVAGAPLNSDVGNQFGKVTIANMNNPITIDSVHASVLGNQLMVYFSEGIYGDGDRTLPATLEHFDLVFDFFSNENLSVEVTGLSNTEGEALSGGERVIVFDLEYTGGLPKVGDRVIVGLNEAPILFDSYGLPVNHELEERYLFKYIMGVTKVIEPDNGDELSLEIPITAQMGEHANAYRLYFSLLNEETNEFELVHDSLFASSNLNPVITGLPQGTIRIEAQSIFIINNNNTDCVITEGEIDVIVKELSCNLAEGALSDPVDIHFFRPDVMGVANILSPTPDTVMIGRITLFFEPGFTANAHKYTVVKGSFADEDAPVVREYIMVQPKNGDAEVLPAGEYEVHVQSLYIRNLDDANCATQTDEPRIVNPDACVWFEGPTTEPVAFTVLEPVVSPIVSSPTDGSYSVDSLHFVLNEAPNANFHHIMIVARDSAASTDQYRYMDRMLPYTGTGLDTTFYWGWQGTFDLYVRNVMISNLDNPQCFSELNEEDGAYYDYYWPREHCDMRESEWSGPISIDGYVSLDFFAPTLYINSNGEEITTEKVEIGYRSYSERWNTNYEFTNGHRLQVAVDSFDVDVVDFALDTVLFNPSDTLLIDLAPGNYEYRVQSLTFINDGNEGCVTREDGRPVELIDINECTILESPFVHKRFTRGEAVSSEFIVDQPLEFSLHQNYPNPFNPSTTLSFDLPEASHVRMDIFNSVGQLVQTVMNEQRSAGKHTVRFNASGLSSGVYLYKITTDNFSQTKKMLLVK